MSQTSLEFASEHQAFCIVSEWLFRLVHVSIYQFYGVQQVYKMLGNTLSIQQHILVKPTSAQWIVCCEPRWSMWGYD